MNTFDYLESVIDQNVVTFDGRAAHLHIERTELDNKTWRVLITGVDPDTYRPQNSDHITVEHRADSAMIRVFGRPGDKAIDVLRAAADFVTSETPIPWDAA